MRIISVGGRVVALSGLLFGLALVALGGCGDDDGQTLSGGFGGSGGDASTTLSSSSVGGSGGAEVPAVEDPFEPLPPATPLDAAQLGNIGAAIDGALANFASKQHSVLVVGADTNQVVYERGADQSLKPASNTKLLTTAAAFADLGRDHQSDAVVYGAAPVAGVVNGDLTIVGRHDVSWSTRFYSSARFPLDRIAAELKAAGVTSVSGSIRASGEFLYNGDNFATYGAAGHRTAAANNFKSALAAVGITSGPIGTSPSFDSPAGTVELARWRSLPMASAAFPTNVISHNEFADILLRHVGLELKNDSSYTAGNNAVKDLLATAPVDAGGEGSGALDLSSFVINDGSGLSHNNRVSARHLVGLFRLMADETSGQDWQRTFAVAGIRGTIGGRMGGANTLGRVFGKTGTLNGVIALSGVLHHRFDGQRYFFSLLMNGVTSNGASRSAHDNIVTAVAADHRVLGPRPDAPVLNFVKNDANDETVLVDWEPVADVERYAVWRSVDGNVYKRSDARVVEGRTTHRTVKFVGRDTIHIRVTALSNAGPSDPSAAYSAMVGPEASEVVVIDGNDRWLLGPSVENVLKRHHDFGSAYGRTLAYPHDSCRNEMVIDGTCALEPYAATIWALGEESTDHETFSSAEQDKVGEYLTAGGALLVSGAELGWDLEASGTNADIDFLHEVLHVAYAGDDAGTQTVNAGNGSPLMALGPISFLTPGAMAINFPDHLAPMGPDASILLSYVAGTGDGAAIEYNGMYRLWVLGFPVESIAHEGDRQALLDEALSFLLGN